MPYKPGFLTSEFYLTIATLIGSTLGLAKDLSMNSDLLAKHPAVAAAVAIALAVGGAAQTIAYTLSRAKVKAASSLSATSLG